MNKEQNRQKDETSDVISALEDIMNLLILEKWNEAHEKWTQELAASPNNVGLISMLLFINSKNNLIDDKTYQNAVTSFVSPEWHPRLDEIRNRALSNHYLKKAMDAFHVSNEKELCHASTPLLEDKDFLESFGYASEKRKEQLLTIQHNQAEEFLKKCIDGKKVSNEADLQTSSLPLAEDKQFQMALKYVSNERQKELHKIQQNQVEHFLQKCMEANKVERESDLQYSASLLPLNNDFNLALKYASPNRQNQIRNIQFSQVENFLKNYLLMNIDLLALKKEPLAEDKLYQQILHYSSPELKGKLAKVQLEQGKSVIDKDEFLLYTNVINKIPAAMYELSMCYMNGTGVGKDLKKALIWLNKAADMGYSEAMLQLGMIYYEGKEIKTDYEKAFEWFFQAAEKKHARAMYQLSLCYRNAKGVDRDLKKEMEWLNKAAENANPEAMFQLGLFFSEGKKTRIDDKKAFEWFLKAANCTHIEAMYHLFDCYHNRKGVERDDNEAWKWLQKAAEHGHSKAKKEYEEIKKIIELRSFDKASKRNGWW